MYRLLPVVVAVVALAAPQLRADTGTASVTVTVPVGATLTINGQPTAQMTAVRLFVTPPLPAGPKYRYVFEATYTWDGEEVIKKQTLDIVVGGTYTVDMTLGQTVKRRPPVEEEEPVEVKKPAPKPAPPKREEPKAKPPEPKPATPAEPPATPKPEPKPEPRKPDDPKPNDPVAQPPRPVAPKPREATPKR